MLTWEPDFCPPGDYCRIRTDAKDQTECFGFDHMCRYHKSLGLSDTETFKVIRTTTSEKERLRWNVKNALGLSKEQTVPYTVTADGRIVIDAGDRAKRPAITIPQQSSDLKIELS